MNCVNCGKEANEITGSLPTKHGFSRYNCLNCGAKFTDKSPKRVKHFSACGKFYYTGKPCKYGHVDYRYVKGSSCVSCKKRDNEKTRINYVKKPISN